MKTQHGTLYSVSRSVFSPRDGGVLLRRLETDSGPALLIRLKRALRVFSTDLRKEIVVLSNDLSERSFSVPTGSKACGFLRSTDVSRLLLREQQSLERNDAESWSVREDVWSSGISMTFGD